MNAITHRQSFDTIDYTASKREMTPEGYMLVRGCKIARTGVQDYMASELGMLNQGDRDHVVGVYRPPEEVFDADSMASFENKPITINHPREFVTADNWKQYSGGHAFNVRREGDSLVADLMFQDSDAIAAVKNGKAQLSNGYEHAIDWQPGKATDGKSFVATQRTIRGNHIAAVDIARAGPEYRVADHQKKELQMTDSNPVKLVNIVRDGQTVAVNDAAALCIAADAKIIDGLKADLAAAQAAGAASAKTITDQAAEIETLKANQLTDAALADITLAIDQSKKIAKDTAITASNPTEIRRAALKAVYETRKAAIDAALCGTALDAATGDQLKIIAGLMAADASPVADGSKPAQDGGFKLPIAPAGTQALDAAGKPLVSAQSAFMDRFNA